MADIKQEIVTCSCLGSNLDKLLQPMILTILAQHEAHGYAIIQVLEELEGEKIDKAGAYRTLKVLEERGHISYYWLDSEDSQKKKIYSLTEDGRACLKNWIETLKNYRRKVDRIVKGAEAVLIETQK